MNRLVEDVAQMPGALPLLSFALSELYWDYLEAVKTEERSDRRSEEHTSELQSLTNLVCRLLLEKKKNKQKNLKF